MKLLRLADLPLVLLAQTARSADYPAAMKAYLDASIRGWSEDGALVTAIDAANTDSSAYDQARIDSLDAAWKAEVGQAATPTIT